MSALAALRFALGPALLLAVGGCAGALPRGGAGAAEGPEAQAVVAAAQQLFDAMEARDSTALRALLHPEAQVIGIAPGGRARVSPGGIEAWIRDVAHSEATLQERMRSPRVEVAGDLATLWAPYVFYVDGQCSHCGTDAFQFVREGAAWRLLVVTFTMQREGCAEGPQPDPP